MASDFSGGELTVKRRLEALGFRISRVTESSALAESSPPGSPAPALVLTLHARYGRHAAFAAVGVAYTPQNQHQNTGLSPPCADSGYLIFITLDVGPKTRQLVTRPAPHRLNMPQHSTMPF